ncbi:MAG TPA: GNAT family N-acetyltransferase [Acidimicrobiales bacterium]|nr:GNAT family N-acetyltransferase [Acidimicrobiales bacterium]
MAHGPLQLTTGSHTRRDLDLGAAVCARAFYDDPFYSYLLASPRRRLANLRHIFRATLIHLGGAGHIGTVRRDDTGIVGVAAWLPPDHYPQPVSTQLAQLPGMVRAFIRTPRSLAYARIYLGAIARVHPKEPHWYLCALASDPSLQRSGAGTLLMHEGLALADREGVGCYLETQKPENLAYYRRFGFELDRTLEPLPDAPPLFTMWRAPR